MAMALQTLEPLTAIRSGGYPWFMIQSGRVVSVEREDGFVRVLVSSGGELSEVCCRDDENVPAPGTYVRVGDAPEGARLEKLGEGSERPGEEAHRWWRPYASRPTRLQRLGQRARVVRALRGTLDEADFLEVQVPLLLRATCPDVHIESFRVGDLYLTTSTEYQLKRMFAGGFDRLYTLTQNFRAGDVGPYHNPEFTMLEWARAYETMTAIEGDAEAMVKRALGAVSPPGTSSIIYRGHTVQIEGVPWERLTVRDALLRHLGVDLDSEFSLAAMQREVQRLSIPIPEAFRARRDDLLTLLLDRLQPHLGTRVPTFLVEWPSFLTTSAPPLPGRPEVAERSELFVAGVEVADGFPFLRDAEVQAGLFEGANTSRRAQGKTPVALDDRYLKALRQGLPPGAGMALGVDRLVMVLTGEEDIRNVVAFAWDEL